MKNTILIFFSIAFAINLNAQKDSLKFAYSPNKFYVGINVAPIAVGALGGYNELPEWKIGAKYRLTDKNHYARLSYGYMINKESYWTQSYYVGQNGHTPQTYDINDSTQVTIGYQQNNFNLHIFNVGYEYQFKIGKKRSASINLATDFTLGLKGSKLYYVNDTLNFKETLVDPTYQIYNREIYNNRSNTTKIRGPLFIWGFTPTVGVGVPLKKHFDLTFEMGFHCVFENDPKFHTKGFSVYYRPSLMLSYRFDEMMKKKSK